MGKERANVYPVRLYKEEVHYINVISELTKKTRGEVLREIIRQHAADAKTNDIKEKKIRAVSDDGLYEITIIRKGR